ncbi:FAD/NAD(P)-binding protein [Glarea lozoyensis ATCC 20868]|uniref:FAD/NAD(P)-binding protein n=1 Tax=Glarea lozoyensis (strain ATCC 20868 / MF5171) TaxID=1116229 RepID=S3CTF7_GLAL2|nr:FAD/NAD(P)-binding protein [Glarea lozoyensis ATCC 20868]EPE28940.1 FAD/NAD(P)-binding protein [Glarea lozoyensis ATCC 20868]
MSSSDTYDYIIIGGGQSGVVVAARLHEAHPHLSIALLEAGPDESHNPAVLSPVLYPTLHGTPLQYSYQTTKQSQLNGREITHWGGRLLSGSSAINYGAWTRGNAATFDAWSALVDDERWSYKSLTPFFQKSEHFHDADADTSQHGLSGPMHTSSGGRDYALREPVKEALLSTGAPFNSDMNDGAPNGLARLVENWHNASRQHAAICYSLDGVHVKTDTVVCRVLFDGKKTTGVELTSGQTLTATREVIISCGALRTPQLLMLSGIGPASEISRLSIAQVVDLPVGQNLHDHGSVNIAFKLKNPAAGYAVGSPLFNKPEYATGNPMDWIVSAAAPDADLEVAAAKDGTTHTPVPSGGSRTDYEVTVMYASTAPEIAPMDGSHITAGVLCLSPTSRGTVTLSSTDPKDNPIVDPQYFTTEHDRAVIRAGIRTAFKAMESDPLKPYIEGETPPPGLPAINSNSTDEELDARVRGISASWFHVAGTASMGQVVDAECKVYGIQGLRVVDCSIMSLSISGHLQAPMYGIAEAAADIIAKSVSI